MKRVSERTARPILFFKEMRSKNGKEKQKGKIKNPIGNLKKSIKNHKNHKKWEKWQKIPPYIHTQCVYIPYIWVKRVHYVHFLEREFRHRSLVG